MNAINLLDKIKTRTARIGIIGLGYVGLPLAIEFVKAGFPVTGFDIDPEKIKLLKQGKSYIKHIDISILTNYQSPMTNHQINPTNSKNSKNSINSINAINSKTQKTPCSTPSAPFKATTDFSQLWAMDCILICVPTPLNKNREPDMTYVFNTTRTIAQYLKRNKLIVLESTTYPGTTDEDMRQILEETGLKAGKDFYLAFSPEREDPANKDFNIRTTPKIVGGYSKTCLKVAKALYDTIVDKTVPVSSTRVAEATKLLENIYRSVNIALVNELKMLFDKMGIDIWEVIEAAKTKPFGFQAFYPGPGLGGHCIVGNEIVWVKNCTQAHVTTIEELFNQSANEKPVPTFGDVECVQPKELNINSIDMDTAGQTWKPITYIFKRHYSGRLMSIATNDNRTISVTERHPMICIKDDALKVIEAKELKRGDLLPIFFNNDPKKETTEKRLIIDVIDQLDHSWDERVRVKRNQGSWKEYKEALYRIENGERKYDWIRDDVIPLGILRKLEEECNISIDHHGLMLLTGRGPSLAVYPAVIEIDAAWARLVGYYLSEGCATKERGYNRIRITINREEKELFDDIKNIAEEKGITLSVSLSSRWKTQYIRLNSPLLGWLLVEYLKCGVNSYTMNIPSEMMLLGRSIKEHLLMGLFRGDGDVHVRSGMRNYRKKNKSYTHHDNSATIGFFSISKVLFHQVYYLLHELGILASIKHRRQRLIVNGYDNIIKMSQWFLDEKQKKIDQYLSNTRRITRKRIFSSIPSVKVKDISIEHKEIDVYSIEVADTHTFAVSEGIYVHNCIPIDPFYLTWKARQYDFATRFIELAGEINTAMPDYVISKVIKALNDVGKHVKGTKILILGLAYKANVDDDRESPSYRLMEKLEALGAKVDYNDPYIPVIKKTREFSQFAGRKSVPVSDKYDLILIATAHDTYRTIDFKSFGIPVVDTRNVIKEKIDLCYSA